MLGENRGWGGKGLSRASILLSGVFLDLWFVHIAPNYVAFVESCSSQPSIMTLS